MEKCREHFCENPKEEKSDHSSEGIRNDIVYVCQSAAEQLRKFNEAGHGKCCEDSCFKGEEFSPKSRKEKAKRNKKTDIQDCIKCIFFHSFDGNELQPGMKMHM